MTQVTVASPLCCAYDLPCSRKGRAVLGPPRDLGGCVNRSILCQTCGRTGEQSTRTEGYTPTERKAQAKRQAAR